MEKEYVVFNETTESGREIELAVIDEFVHLLKLRMVVMNIVLIVSFHIYEDMLNQEMIMI